MFSRLKQFKTDLSRLITDQLLWCSCNIWGLTQLKTAGKNDNEHSLLESVHASIIKMGLVKSVCSFCLSKPISEGHWCEMGG